MQKQPNGGFPRFSVVGESALLVELADDLSPVVNRRVHAIAAWLTQESIKGVREWVPAYASLLVVYDPLLVSLPAVQERLEAGIYAIISEKPTNPRCWEIGVFYGGADGPDLDFVADFHRLSTNEVIERHTASVYQVGMMGFTPGFAYLIGLDPGLATPRRKTPRTHVPRGSVGIAGEQTGIYPIESPGGWQLIGRTERVLFNPSEPPYFYLSPGDEVRFFPLRVGDLQ